MRKSVVYSTENSNWYLFDAQHMFSLLIHPNLVKVYEQSIDLDSYYLHKYEYQKKHGFWGKVEPANIETVFDESIVKENIMQTQQIIFEVTDHCNLKCMYCSFGELYDFKKKNRKRNINIRYAINLLKFIVSNKLNNKQGKLILSFYGGEPLMNINFIKKIVDTAHKLNVEGKLDIKFAMTTNATLIHKHIDFLVENKFELTISLDGSEAGHSYRTFAKNNQNSFQKVIENTDMIQRDFPDYFADNVGFYSILNNRNSIKDIYEFIYNRYQKIPMISPINANNINPDKQYLFELMFQSKRKSEEEYLKETSNLLPGIREQSPSYVELSRFLRDYSINFYSLNPLFLLYDEIILFPTGTCMPFAKKIFLNTSHNLLPCEKISHKHSMGKVNKNVIIDISGIAQKYSLYYDKIIKVCKNCYVSRACSVCMFNIENLDSDDPVCNWFQDRESFINKTHRIFSLLEKKPTVFFEITDKEMIK